jgi:hypothetical protein
MPSLGDRNRKDLAIAARGRRIGGVEQLLPVRSEDGEQVVQVRGLGRVVQGAHRSLGRVERAMRRWSG